MNRNVFILLFLTITAFACQQNTSEEGVTGPTSSDESMQEWIDSMRPNLENHLDRISNLEVIEDVPVVQDLNLGQHKIDFRYLIDGEHNPDKNIDKVSHDALQGGGFMVGENEMWSMINICNFEKYLSEPYETRGGSEDGRVVQRENTKDGIEGDLALEYLLVIQTISYAPPYASSGTNYSPGYFQGSAHFIQIENSSNLGGFIFEASNKSQVEYSKNHSDSKEDLQKSIDHDLKSNIEKALEKKLEEISEIEY